MNKINGLRGIVASAVMSAAFALPATAAETPLEADLILSHGKLYTPTGWAQAAAIQNGVLIAVGDEASVEAHRTARTNVIDLKGAAVLPGLHDMHVHPMGAGLTALACRFPQGSGPKEVMAAVQKCASGKAKDEWITGGQWDAASFGKHPPERTFLDRAAPDNPVVLTDISGHSAWANSKALQLAGISSKTPNPPGGIIERDAKGEPTGLLRESGAALVRGIVPPSTPEQNARALSSSLALMLSFGITSFTDAVVEGNILQAYATLADQGVLKQRVRGCLVWRPAPPGASAAEPDYIQLRNRYARERFAPTCIKMFLDGVPTDGHTAAMVEAYENTQGMDAERAKGLLLVPPATLNAAVTDFDRRGFTVKFHAAGDAAVRAGLDAIEAARKANGFTGLLHQVGHDSFVQMSDIRRGRALAATFEFSPYIWYPNPIIPDIAKAVGEERMQRWIPVKDALDAGALVVPGSDWSVVPSVNPWIAIETLVTRQKPGGGGDVLGAAERITVEQAIDLFTVNSARAMGDRNQVGTIERGMLADLIVLDRNPLEVPITDVHDTKVRMTLINGEIVYRAPE
jgi:predicted amidohydrolase YtcJ